MAGRDRPNVALSSKQRNHRRLPHEDGSLTASSLRFSKLQKLPIEGCCNVFLRKLGSGSAPIFGVEPILWSHPPESNRRPADYETIRVKSLLCLFFSFSACFE